ncbi:hypothetical protein E1B28_005136 [Marasmius oreades]|uniref:Uncharacterized protein n=1 Tax=Marasmius oreades TaxID=181124 RepID=A0A9P7V050_9AGAR|nr:uncharacterized protein E1B28_005136 [Marasmius oreades]KAG7097818.1 hypothetical protein E1B28_005136 [Marasmius oreades]
MSDAGENNTTPPVPGPKTGYYGPQEPPALIWLENTYFAGNIMGGICYGRLFRCSLSIHTNRRPFPLRHDHCPFLPMCLCDCQLSQQGKEKTNASLCHLHVLPRHHLHRIVEIWKELYFV